MTIVDLTDSKRVISFIGSNVPTYVIYNPDTNTYNPNYNTTKPVLEPYLQVDGSMTNMIAQATSVKWYYQPNSMGDLVEIVSGQDNYVINPTTHKLSINTNMMALYTFMKYYCEISYRVGQEEFISFTNIEFVKIVNGTSGDNPITMTLTNDYDTIHTDTNGDNGNYTNISTQVIVYDGTIDVTESWSITASATLGVVGTFNDNIYHVTGMTTDTGKVTFVATRGNQTLERQYTINKIKSGRDGHFTRVRADYSVIKKDQQDQYTPTSVRFFSEDKLADQEWIPYPAAFRVSTSLGDTNFDLHYESTSLQTSYNYVVAPNISLIKVEIFTNTTFTQMIDYEIIQVVVDGKDSYLSLIQTPEGTTSRNSESILKAKMALFKADAEVQADSYQWYKLNVDASGDSNSGNGWKVLDINDNDGISGYNSNTITVPPTAIQNNETFMCIAFIGSRRFTNTITLVDISDPYVLAILGNTVFKNSEGVNTYLCKVYLNGVEMDTDPTNPLYSYKWDLYDSVDRQKPNFNKIGKQITVAANEIDGNNFLTCTVTQETD